MNDNEHMINIDSFMDLPDDVPNSIVEAGDQLLKNTAVHPPKEVEAGIRYRMGLAHIHKGEFEAAFRALSAARHLHEELEDTPGILTDQLAFGVIYYLSEQFETAFEMFLYVRDQAKKLQRPLIEASALCNLGRICGDQGRYDEGLELLKNGERLAKDAGSTAHTARYHREVGRINLAQGQIESAVTHLAQALEKAGDTRGPFGYEYLITYGEAKILTEEFEEANRLLNTALLDCRKNGILRGEIEALYLLGKLSMMENNVQDAEQQWRTCFELTDTMMMRHYRIKSAEALSRLCHEMGNFECAFNYMEEIRRMESSISDERIQHTISVHDQSMRIDDLEREMLAWRRRSVELEKIRKEREESIRELETIKNIGQEITATLDPDVIIDILYDRLSQLVTVDAITIAFTDDEKNNLDFHFVIEDGMRLPPDTVPLNKDRSLSSWSVLNDRDIMAGSREEVRRYTKDLEALPGTHGVTESFLVVRLKIGGRIIGAISVQANARNIYKQRHMRLLQALAGFIAIALSNSHAHQGLMTANEKIAHMATHDALTGLPNRMQIMTRLDQELIRCRRYKESLAVLFIDLDGFKPINDTYGHNAGDAVLKTISQRLVSGVRATDAVGRLAGDEFLVILTDNCIAEDGQVLGEKIREQISLPITHEDKDMQVSASIGLSFYPEDGDSPEVLINAADEAMYQSKAGGKNRVSFYSGPPISCDD